MNSGRPERVEGRRNHEDRVAELVRAVAMRLDFLTGHR
jgi:hypothetical protein